MMKKKKIATFAVAVTGSIALGVAMGGCGVSAMSGSSNAGVPAAESTLTFWTDENMEGDLLPPSNPTQAMIDEQKNSDREFSEARYVTSDGRWQATCVYFDGGLDCV